MTALKKRIPKKEKADFEASAFLNIQGVEYLLILGSGSKPLRKKVSLIPYQQRSLVKDQAITINTDHFIGTIQLQGINEVNFEGITTIGKNILIGNRGNRENIANHLILTDEKFWNSKNEVTAHVMALEVPPVSDAVPGISELYYEESLDLLFIALSSEATDNAYDDGAIGNSYIGWIRNFKNKIPNPSLTMSGIYCLTDIHSDFKGQKIEGLCIELIENNAMILHLISDNDNGESKLFKMKMAIPY